jgi:hypothetical protein
VTGEPVWLLPRQDGPEDVHGNRQHWWPSPGDPQAVEFDAKVAKGPAGRWREPSRDDPDTVDVWLIVPPGVRVAGVDRMWVRGQLFHVDRESFAWVNPWTGVERGSEVPLRRTEG